MRAHRTRTSVLVGALILAGSTALARPASYVPPNGLVPDEKTAIQIAEAVLLPIYGREVILGERPFRGTLHGDVWTVAGTLHCTDAAQRPRPSTDCVGGTAIIDISKRDGRVLRVIHEL